MKRIFLLLALFLSTQIVGFAQAPEGINYQAVARDLTGAEMPNTIVAVQVQILNSALAVVYQEDHSTSTNAFGLFNIVIGQGSNPTSTFSNINWATGPYNLKISIDANGSGLVNMGYTQLWSVPYALYAKESANGPQGLPGISCWDANGNGVNDPAEDVNGDNFWNALDCQGDSGAIGATGPSGAQGIQGVAGPSGPQGPGIDSIISNANGTVTIYYNASSTTTGPLTGPTGPQGPQGDGILSIMDNGDGTLTINYGSGTVVTGNLYGPAGPSGSVGATGPQGPSGSAGPTGDGISTIIDNGNGTFTILYGSANTFTTSNFTGPTGPAGSVGATGAVGPTGAVGATGANGAPGTAGSPGINGATGATGPTGAAGTAGGTGATGAAGATGATGLTGTNGTNGTNGATGANGAAGVTGATGSAGGTGATGLTGASGATGATGATGSTGAIGDRYATTSSSTLTIACSGTINFFVGTGLAYSAGQSVIIANSVSNLMIGTVSSYTSGTGAITVILGSGCAGSGTFNSWSINLNGAPGPAGATGPTGASVTGPSGANGATGPTGLTGPSGANGATGVAGPSGATGVAGATGAAGPTGNTGAAGPSGVAGATGAAGANGATGASGATGATGPLVAGSYGQTLYNNGSTWVATSTIYNDVTNSRVGIGTVPSYPLHVSTSQQVSGYFESSDVNYSSLYVNANSATGNPTYGYSRQTALVATTAVNTSNDWYLRVGAWSNPLYLKSSSGFLGIHNNNPTEQVHAQTNTTSVSRYMMENWNTSGAGGFVVKGPASTNDVFEIVHYGTGYVGSTAGTVALANLSMLYTGAGAGAMMLQTVSSNPIYFATANTLQMTLTTGGDLGIGLTGPTQRLHLRENANTHVGLVIENTNTGASSGERIYFDNEEGSLAGILAADVASTTPGALAIFNNRSQGHIRLNTGGVVRLVVASNGNVGIGANHLTPLGMLHVRGADWNSAPVIVEANTAGNVGPSIRFTGATRTYDIIGATSTGASTGADFFAVWDNTGGAYRLVINSGGTVGIGMNIPQTGVRFDVAENALAYAGYFRNNVVGSYGLFSFANPSLGSGYGFRTEGGYMGAYLEAYAPGYTSTIYGAYCYANGAGSTGTRYGVYGFASGATTNYGGYFNGNVNVTGVLSKGSGTFRIDHPQDPENKYLVHSFVESPDMMNVYNGNIVTDSTGTAIVLLPTYFEAENVNFKYQLTVIGQFAQAIVAEEVQNNQFVIKTDKPGVKVSWQVTGVRNDKFAQAHPVVPEEEKKPEEKGKYLHPELYGLPVSAGINPPPTKEAPDPGKAPSQGGVQQQQKQEPAPQPAPVQAGEVIKPRK